eukprot:TRINITY_DN9346_c0_g1_i4.p1 TRINITY_DN9346_c0_g1~~TRINITY_DN9346_c0_g1_i4.p1  ORF type:complete len:108 (-),score=22.57 TRINITY_DN9346_c0_g1_i4:11-334(-)
MLQESIIAKMDDQTQLSDKLKEMEVSVKRLQGDLEIERLRRATLESEQQTYSKMRQEQEGLLEKAKTYSSKMILFEEEMKSKDLYVREIGRAVQQECRDRSRMPSSA